MRIIRKPIDNMHAIKTRLFDSTRLLSLLAVSLLVLLNAGCGKEETEVLDEDPQGEIVEAVWSPVASEDCLMSVSGPGDPTVSTQSIQLDDWNARMNKFEFDLFENSYVFWCARVQEAGTISQDPNRLLSLMRDWGLEDETLTQISYLGHSGFESLVDGPFGLAGDNVIRGFQVGNTFVIVAAYEGSGESHMQRFFDSLALEQPI